MMSLEVNHERIIQFVVVVGALHSAVLFIEEKQSMLSSIEESEDQTPAATLSLTANHAFGLLEMGLI